MSSFNWSKFYGINERVDIDFNELVGLGPGGIQFPTSGGKGNIIEFGGNPNNPNKTRLPVFGFAGLEAGLAAQLGYDYGAKLDLGSANARLESGVNITLKGDFATFGDTSREPEFEFDIDTVPTRLDWNLVTPEFRAWAYLTYAAGIDLDYYYEIPLPSWVKRITGSIGDSGNIFHWADSGRSGTEFGYPSTTLSGSSTLSSLRQLERQMLGEAQPAWAREILPYVDLRFFSPPSPSPQTTNSGFSLGSRFPILEITGDLDRAISDLTGIPFSGDINLDLGIGHFDADWSLIDVNPALRLYGYYDLALEFAVEKVEIWSAEAGISAKISEVKPGDITSQDLSGASIANLLRGINLPDTNNNKQFDFELRWNPTVTLTPKLGFVTEFGYEFGALNASIDLGVDLDFGWLGSWSSNWNAKVPTPPSIPKNYRTLFSSDTPITIPGLTDGRKVVTPSWLQEIKIPLRIPRGLTDARLFDLEARLAAIPSFDEPIDIPSLKDTTQTSTINIPSSVFNKVPWQGLAVRLPENIAEISVDTGVVPLVLSLPSFGNTEFSRQIEYNFPGFTLNSKPGEGSKAESLPAISRTDKLTALPQQSATIEYIDERCQIDSVAIADSQVTLDLSCGNDEVHGTLRDYSFVAMGEGDDEALINIISNPNPTYRDNEASFFDQRSYSYDTLIDLGSGNDTLKLGEEGSYLRSSESAPQLLSQIRNVEILFDIDGQDKIDSKAAGWFNSSVTARGGRESGRVVELKNQITRIPGEDAQPYYLITNSSITTEIATAAIEFENKSGKIGNYGQDIDDSITRIAIDYSQFDPGSLDISPSIPLSTGSQIAADNTFNNWAEGVSFKITNTLVEGDGTESIVTNDTQEAQEVFPGFIQYSDHRVEIIGTSQDDTFILDGFASRIDGGGGNDRYILNSPYGIYDLRTNKKRAERDLNYFSPIGLINDGLGESTLEIHDGALRSFYNHGAVTLVNEFGTSYEIIERNDGKPFGLSWFDVQNGSGNILEDDEVTNLLASSSNWKLDLTYLSENQNGLTFDSKLFYTEDPISRGNELYWGKWQPSYVKLPKSISLPKGDNFLDPANLFGELDGSTLTGHVTEDSSFSDRHILMPYEHLLEPTNTSLVIKLNSGNDLIYGYTYRDIIDMSNLALHEDTAIAPHIGFKGIFDNDRFDDDTIILPRSLDELLLETIDNDDGDPTTHDIPSHIIRFKSENDDSGIELQLIENVVIDGITFNTKELFNLETMPLIVRGIPSTLISRNLSDIQAIATIEKLLTKKIVIQTSDFNASTPSNDPNHLIKVNADNPDLATITIPKEVFTSAIQSLDGTPTSLSFPYDYRESNPLGVVNEFGYPSLTEFEQQAVALPADASALVRTMGFNEDEWNVYRNVLATNKLNTDPGSYAFSRNISTTTIEGRYIFSSIGKQDAVNTLKASKTTLGLQGAYSTPASTIQFIQSPAIQEIYLAALTLANHKRFIASEANGNYYKSLSTDEQLGLLTYAHNEGFSAAEKFLSTGLTAVRSGLPVTNFRDHLLYELDIRRPIAERSSLEQLLYALRKDNAAAQPTLNEDGDVVIHLSKEITLADPQDPASEPIYEWPNKINFDYRISTAGGHSFTSSYEIYIVDQSYEQATVKAPEEEGLKLTPKLGSGVTISNEAVLKIDDKSGDGKVSGDELELDLNGNKRIDPFERLPKSDILATGIIRFDLELTDIKNNPSADIVVDLQNPVKANAYKKWYDNTWIDFLYNPATPLDGGAELIDRNKDGLVEKIILHVTDNQRGDNNEAIGFIEDPGVLALSDTTAPTVTARSVNGSTLTLTLNEDLEATVPALGRFTVLVGGVARAVTSASVNPSGKTVTLQLASPVTSGQAVTLAYTDPAGDQTTGVIEDAVGNDLASFAAQAMNNTTEKDEADNHAPSSLELRLKQRLRFRSGKALGALRTKDPDLDDTHIYRVHSNKKKFASGRFFSIDGNKLVFSANPKDVSGIRRFKFLISSTDQAGKTLTMKVSFANPLRSHKAKTRGERSNRRQSFDTDIHNNNVSEALPFLNADALRNISTAQDAVDTIFSADQYLSKNHFDNNNFTEAIRNINSQYSQIIIESVSNKGQLIGEGLIFREYKALRNFGRILHAVQDFYAHTNWIELGFDPSFNYYYLGGSGDPQILFDNSYTYLPELKPGHQIGTTNIVPITIPGSPFDSIGVLGGGLGTLKETRYDLNNDGEINTLDKAFYWSIDSSHPYAIEGTTTSGRVIGALSSGLGAPLLYGQPSLTDIALKTQITYEKSVGGKLQTFVQPWVFDIKGFDHGGMAGIDSSAVGFLSPTISPNPRLDLFTYRSSAIQKDRIKIRDLAYPIGLSNSTDPDRNNGFEFWRTFLFENPVSIQIADRHILAPSLKENGAFLGPLSKDKPDSRGANIAKELSNRQVQHEFVRLLYNLDASRFDVQSFGFNFLDNTTKDSNGLTARDRFNNLMQGENSEFDSLTGRYLNLGIPKSNAAQRSFDSEVINYLAGRDILSSGIPSPSFDYKSGPLFVDSTDVRAEWLMSLDRPGLTVTELKSGNVLLPSSNLDNWSHYLHQ
ncbi:SwmB domain-containing protein [Vulcanococcus sp. Clear-D1]|uniref:SwmB domain-containing protein n=1 Tax=Vulcanococcus sp. Clear-D1 TaxID=2766970 RepID=UPI0019B045E0|nr:SwmB domain-containing protein [Vulcanococcus sp. Clear-D1]MBD1194643.1 hypothetical protein [Vulcanococcus sp. Clear-D1]